METEQEKGWAAEELANATHVVATYAEIERILLGERR